MDATPLLSPHAFTALNPRVREGVTVSSRRGVLKASLAGLAGLSLPGLLQAREAATAANRPMSRKSVILLWMAGGPSHIDTWDPKPDAPLGNRGPFGTIATKLPGVRLCEHYPKQAAMMDKFTLIRSMVCRSSNHQPNMVMQTANLAAEPRINKDAVMYPAIGSIVAKHRGANHPSLPPYVALNVRDRTHFAWGGYLGKSYDPFVGDQAASLFKLPSGISMGRLESRLSLSKQMDQLRTGLDLSGTMEGYDTFTQKAYDLLAGERAQRAFDLTQESTATLERYGSHDWCRQALLARRLVESGVSFVTLDLSNHSASGTWDTHGDNIPPYGGIMNGLRPLLPVFDHLVTTLVKDLEERGLLDEVLVIAMGEFGRTPQIGTQGSTDGRNHWPVVMSMLMAGGGFRHGQVIGATDKEGGDVKERPILPGDLAATIFHHMGVPLNETFTDLSGRPQSIVQSQGRVIAELV